MGKSYEPYEFCTIILIYFFKLNLKIRTDVDEIILKNVNEIINKNNNNYLKFKKRLMILLNSEKSNCI